MNKTLLELRGIITVLNTPFDDRDRIDCEGLKRNIAYAMKAGVAGFLVPAMASEVGKLTDSERATLLECVLEEVNGGVPVIGGASAPTAAERKRHAKKAIAAGCAGLLVSIPYQSVPQYTSDVHDLAELEPGFLMLQDWDPAGDGLPLTLICELFDTVPAFRCLKIETAFAGPKYSRVIDATQGRLHVSGGWAVMQMIEGLDRGVHAFMPTGLHYAYTRIFQRYSRGDRLSARELFERVLPILAFSNQHLDHSVHFFKRLLHTQGIYATPRVRQPISPFDDIHERIGSELIHRAISIEVELARTQDE